VKYYLQFLGGLLELKERQSLRCFRGGIATYSMCCTPADFDFLIEYDMGSVDAGSV